MGETEEAHVQPAGCLVRRAQRYYTPQEVAAHNTPHDCWVSFLGGVYDLTQVIKDNPGRKVEPILQAAGTDISQWFDPATGDVRTYVHPETQLRVPYCPQGEFVHLSPMWPCTGVDCGGRLPWWKDSLLRVGALSEGTRLVRVRNVLTGQEDALEVPREETVGELQARYLPANAHAASYSWKALKRREGSSSSGGSGDSPPSSSSSAAAAAAGAFDWEELDLNKTLEANGVPDERAAFEAAGLPGDEAVPVLHVYWNDDLTVA